VRQGTEQVSGDEDLQAREQSAAERTPARKVRGGRPARPGCAAFETSPPDAAGTLIRGRAP
jgi:hypothetical protein